LLSGPENQFQGKQHLEDSETLFQPWIRQAYRNPGADPTAQEKSHAEERGHRDIHQPLPAIGQSG
jgi:hypothetical protein